MHGLWMRRWSGRRIIPLSLLILLSVHNASDSVEVLIDKSIIQADRYGMVFKIGIISSDEEHITAIQMEGVYPTDIMRLVNVYPAESLLLSGKDLQFSEHRGQVRILIFGLNQSTIPSGTLCDVVFECVLAECENSEFTLTNVKLSSPEGRSVPWSVSEESKETETTEETNIIQSRETTDTNQTVQIEGQHRERGNSGFIKPTIQPVGQPMSGYITTHPNTSITTTSSREDRGHQGNMITGLGGYYGGYYGDFPEYWRGGKTKQTSPQQSSHQEQINPQNPRYNVPSIGQPSSGHIPDSSYFPSRADTQGYTIPAPMGGRADAKRVTNRARMGGLLRKGQDKISEDSEKSNDIIEEDSCSVPALTTQSNELQEVENSQEATYQIATSKFIPTSVQQRREDDGWENRVNREHQFSSIKVGSSVWMLGVICIIGLLLLLVLSQRYAYVLQWIMKKNGRS